VSRRKAARATKDRAVIEQVILEMVSDNEAVINSDTADEASKRLGKNVDPKEISKIRNQIGLGSFHLHMSNIVSRVSRAIHSYYH